MYCQMCKELSDQLTDFFSASMVDLRQHAESHRFQIGSADFEISVEEVIAMCFPAVSKKEVQGLPISKNTADSCGQPDSLANSALMAKEANDKVPLKVADCPLKSYCRQFFKNSSKRLRCALCTRNLHVSSNGYGLRMETIRAHAFSHLGGKLFKCGMCKWKVDGPENLRNHYNKRHGMSRQCPNATSIISEVVAENFGRLCSTIERCFGKQQEGHQHVGRILLTVGRTIANHQSAAKTASSLKPRTPKMGTAGNRKGAVNDKLSKACFQILKGLPNPPGRLTCKLCQESIIATHVTRVGWSSRLCLDHVLARHSNLEAYICKYCSKPHTGYNLMRNHITGVHRKRAAGGFIDRTVGNEEVIVDIFAQCFGHSAPALNEPQVIPASDPSSTKPEYAKVEYRTVSKAFECSECGFVTKFETLMKRHMQIKHMGV